MKNIRIPICLTFLIAGLGLQTALGKDASASAEQLQSEIESNSPVLVTNIAHLASAEQLRSKFEAGLKAKDAETVLSLFNWQGVSTDTNSRVCKQDMSRRIGGAVQQEKRPVVGVNLLPLPAGYEATNEVDGIRYYPNVHVLGFLGVSYTNESNADQYPYGESNGAFYLAGTIQEIFDAHAKKSIGLGVMVMGLFPKESPGILKCSYIYLAGGKEKTGGFQCTNNWSTSFWGDGFKSCKVTKLSGDGSFQLTVNEAGKTVFDSDMVETNDVIVYEKK